MRKALLALAIAATSVTAMAEDAEPAQDFNTSAFIGIKSTDFENDLGYSIRLNGGTVGFYMSGESDNRFGLAITRMSGEEAGTSVDLTSIDVISEIPIGNGFVSFVGEIGYGRVDIELWSGDIDDSGLHGAAGFAFNMNEQIALTVKYEHQKVFDYTFDGIQLGLNYKF